MSTLIRFGIFALILLFAFGGIVLAYRLIVDAGKEPLLTISTSGKFSSKENKIDNGEKFRIINDNSVNQTVKISGSNQTLAEIEAKSSSGLLSLDRDSKNILYLASNSQEKTTIIVGEPKTESKSNDSTNTDSNTNTDNNTDSNSSNNNSNSSSTNTNTNTAPAVTPPSQTGTTTSNEPLPDTGPGDVYLFSLSAFVGLVIYRFSNFFWKKTIK